MCGTADKSTHAVSFLLEATRGIGRKNLVQEQLLSFLLFNFLSYLSQLALKKKEKRASKKIRPEKCPLTSGFAKHELMGHTHIQYTFKI